MNILGKKLRPVLRRKNCDTMKKARSWLESKKVAYAFHDYKAAGIDKATLEGWVKKVAWQVLINRARCWTPKAG
jgi:arsenate reductase-like glutaredoxin family protein